MASFPKWMKVVSLPKESPVVFEINHKHPGFWFEVLLFYFRKLVGRDCYKYGSRSVRPDSCPDGGPILDSTEKKLVRP